MQISQRFKMTVDILMTILSIVLMGGTMMFPDERVHQILGMTLLALWILHTIFNRRWYASLFKGNYPPYRIMQIIVNVGIALCALCLMVSGLMMAWFLPIPNGMGVARSMHLVASHWYYIFMCAHLGMHLGMIFSRIKAKKTDYSPNSTSDLESNDKVAKSKKLKTIFSRIILLLICAYGVFAFIIRGIWKYLFLSQQFFFFDLERGYILFAVDYLSILILIAIISYLLGKTLQNLQSKKQK